ncbi:MMPL family transporter [Streptomyces roseolilacinus]|uniref:Membrane protein n=1 Tax=Streptomyces roseolilacinus TaxID=66904 RepID=A0A918B256_9ACTN|nr:MMPL family transporter [Streptomyces roseolilacinus]GGQ16629.1 membrane protein [Streptomyces roseolilacinus]
MSAFLYRLGRFCYRRRGAVIGAWLGVLVVAGVSAFALMKPFTSATAIPGTEAQRALDVMEREFPSAGEEHVTGTIVFRAPDGRKITAGQAKQDVARAVEEADRAPGVVAVTAPSAEAGNVSADGRTGIAEIVFVAEKADGIPAETKQSLEKAATEARSAGLTVELGGAAFNTLPPVMGPTEVVGVLIALAVLVLVFRTLRGAIVPVATALVGVLSLLALTSVITMDSTSIILAVMLGLAVGIDYALFIVSRHQTQVRQGMGPEESAGLATGTAGGAVVFAGATVVVALAALAIVDVPFLTVMGLGAAATVVVSVLIAVTLLPAVLGLMGGRIATSTVPVLARRSRSGTRRTDGSRTPGERWAAGAARRPWLVLVVCVLGLGVLAAPAADLRLGLSATNDPHSSAARAQKMIDEGFGPGHGGGLVVLAQGENKAIVTSAARELADRIEGLPGVAAVSPVVPAASGKAALVNVTPSSSPGSEETTRLLKEIREVRGGVETSTGTQVDVTGTTAVNIDVVDKLSAALPLYCLVVMGLALILLTLVFRAVAVPLKAALGFLLSLGASLGVLVAVFQWGWLAGLLGVAETGPVLSFLPMLLVGILFGLAMDYEVFLVSRMREEYARGTAPTEAMIRGFGHSAKVVTAAAAIMIAVFGGFVFAEMQVIKGMGLALAVGVLMDAFVVRMTLVPAVMALLGRKAWWLPRFLGRVLPDVDIEGGRLMRHKAASRPEPTAVEAQPVGEVSAGTRLT